MARDLLTLRRKVNGEGIGNFAIDFVAEDKMQEGSGNIRKLYGQRSLVVLGSLNIYFNGHFLYFLYLFYSMLAHVH